MEELVIISDPKIMLGKPIIKGTRITVEHLLHKFANGLTIEQVLAEYPHLTRQGIIAALRFAAESLRTSETPSDQLEGFFRRSNASSPAGGSSRSMYKQNEDV